MSSGLTWALVIATKDRLEALRHCVRFALSQSRPPAEVIIVDASADWQNHRDEIAALMADHAGVRFVYEQAPRPSLTMQRNAGIQAATADILFLIDDDSFLYPDAAETIMHIYEKDRDGAVAGVQVQPVPHPPETITDGGSQKTSDVDRFRIRSGRLRRLVRRLLQYGHEARWIPYEGEWPDRPLPGWIHPPALRRARLFGGFRMTFRRDVAARLLFDPLLLYYCPGEDMDFSYRASREGALVSARDARVHHYNSGGGRLKRRQVTLLSALNRASFLRRHAPDQIRARRAYARSMLHRAFGDAVRDIGMGAFALPGMRGTLRGLWMARRVFAMSPDALAGSYPALQEQIVRGVSD